MDYLVCSHGDNVTTKQSGGLISNRAKYEWAQDWVSIQYPSYTVVDGKSIMRSNSIIMNWTM